MEFESDKVLFRANTGFTQEELASYLGISRPVLSKDLSALKRKGIIRLDREWVTVLDSDALWGD